MRIGFLSMAVLLAGCATAPFGPAAPEMAARDSARWPAANAQGRIIATGEPTDVAIQGDGFFVLAARKQPEGIGELIFTRDGAFKFEEIPGPQPGTGTYRLVNRDGLFVMGYQTAVDPDSRPFGTSPNESIDAFATWAGNGPGKPPIEVKPAAIELDIGANPDLANNATFDVQGMLRIGGDAPKRPGGGALNVHLTLAAFSFAQYLERLEHDTYRHRPAAGRVFFGTAANAGAGDIGKMNEIVSRALERR